MVKRMTILTWVQPDKTAPRADKTLALPNPSSCMAFAGPPRLAERVPTEIATILTTVYWTTTSLPSSFVMMKVSWDESGRLAHLLTKSAPSHSSSARNRPLSNPDLFKTNVAPPQSGPVDEVDAVDRKLQRQPSPGAASKSAKWQPLTSIAPNPESDENDPFSLGDSDDEKETKTKDHRESDTARLKEAARNSVTSESADAPQKGLQASERSGSTNVRDKEAEAILTGKKA